MKTHKTLSYHSIITIILLFFNAIMLIFPKEILEGAKKGLLLWYNNVIPSLFPFMVFTAMLVELGFPQRLGRAAEPLFGRLFNASGEGAFAVAAGAVSGCPLGAKTVCDLYNRGLITKNEGERLVMFCNNTGPLFVVGAVGEGMLKNRNMGLLLLAVLYTSAFIMGIITGLLAPKEKNKGLHNNRVRERESNFSHILSNGVMSGINGITVVGGYIVLFSVICTVLEVCGITELLPLDEGLAFGILEVTNGCGRVKLPLDRGSFALLCSIIAWGGFSIHAQSASFMRESGISVKKYLLGKAVQGVLAGALGALVYGMGDLTL